MIISFLANQLKEILRDSVMERVAPRECNSVPLCISLLCMAGVVSLLIGEGILAFYAMQEIGMRYSIPGWCYMVIPAGIFILQGLIIFLMVRSRLRKMASESLIDSLAIPSKVFNAFLKGFVRK